MISRELADQLGLTVVGQNRGRDANRAEVVTDVAVIDRLSIGGVTFRSVPVMIHDFRKVDPDGCFIGSGVIGSEIFPGSAWQIDTEHQRLGIASRADLLMSEEAAGQVQAAPLRDFGYPHAPVFSYAIGGMEDHGLFDTGSSEAVTLFRNVAGDRKVKKAMVRGTVRPGKGSEGVSAGGAGEVTDLLRFDIEGMKVGQIDLGRREGALRQAPPTLLGLGLLRTHRVTLDYPEGRFLFEPRNAPAPEHSFPGYALRDTGNEVRVVQLFEGSRAAKAGLKLGDEVVAMDGAALPVEGDACAAARWLVESRPAETARTLTILRGGKRVDLSLD